MSGYGWGGSENLWAQTAKRLAGEGHQVYASVVRCGGPRPELAKLRASGVTVSERPQSLVPIWAKVAQKLGLTLSQKVLRSGPRRWLAAIRPDLVCVSNGDVAYGTDWLRDCQALGIGCVNVAQANHEQYWPADDLADELRRVFMAAQRCFFVSEGNLRLFEKQIAQSLPNAEVVRNPFNVRWDAQCPWPSGSQVWQLACIGRLEPYAKGQDLLMEVLSRAEWRERAISVSIYGQGPFETSLRRLAEHHGLSGRVRFCGHVDDVEAVWAGHHALIMPSRYEGLPLVMVEAMLCARPVIATDVAGHRELIDEGVTGFLAEAPTTHLLAAAMERAWNRRAEWQSMGAEASRRVRQRVPRDPAGIFATRLLELASGD
jgi:glycosyltransferase involved in cell wall biosynthesis